MPQGKHEWPVGEDDHWRLTMDYIGFTHKGMEQVGEEERRRARGGVYTLGNLQVDGSGLQRRGRDRMDG